MKISITGKQITVGDSLREHVEKNFEASVVKYFSDPLQASVAFSKEGDGVKVDLSVHPIRGIVLQGRASGQDSFFVFDEACTHIAKQLRRYKKRIASHKGKGRPTLEAAQLSVFAPELSEELPEEEATPIIVAEMTADIPQCTVSGAVMRMDLANENAMMFRNSAHDGLNVVYRRADGNIGWIDPKV